MKERQIEQALVRAVRMRDGLPLKLISPGLSGVPDRLLLFPGGRIGFVEVKAPGLPLRALQIKRKSQLEALGFLVYRLDDAGKIGAMLDEIYAP